MDYDDEDVVAYLRLAEEAGHPRKRVLADKDFPEPDIKRITVDTFTEDQIAMAVHLGGDPDLAEVAYTQISLPPSVRLPGVADLTIINHVCPIIEWRGVPRRIMPNGDIITYHRREDAISSSER